MREVPGRDQIVDGDSGALVDDPADLGSFGRAVRDVATG